MKIIVNQGRCTGLGICESIAPDFFEIGDDGSLELQKDRFDESDRARIEEAVTSCPTLALSVTDED